jgi:hypothetical protein
MTLVDSKGALNKAAKDLYARWLEVEAVWSDAQAKEFEKTYLAPLQQDLRAAMTAMDHMDQVLQRIKSDCE